MRYQSDAIGRNLEPHPFDKDFEGQYHASHAERQMSVVSPDHPIGLSKPMCNDCQGFFCKQAQHTCVDQVVTDPNGTWILRGSGDVVPPRPRE